MMKRSSAIKSATSSDSSRPPRLSDTNGNAGLAQRAFVGRQVARFFTSSITSDHGTRDVLARLRCSACATSLPSR
jgi:hypothetical protein